MNSGRPIVRIAHAYGNRRHTLAEALASEAVDMIEADMWYRGGRIEVRHERRLGRLPLLADRRPRGVPRTGPWALPLPGRRYLRLDVSPLLARELLSAARTKRLLLDLKADESTSSAGFATALARAVDEADAARSVAVCGQHWPVLDRLREIAPHLEVRYSMQRPQQMADYQERLERGTATTRVCIHHRLLEGDPADFLRAKAVDVYCWTVDDEARAAELVEAGADGIISNDLKLLAALPAA